METVQTLWAAGAFSRPGELWSQWRHRAAFSRLSRSLFYHRYASAILLAHEVGLFEALAAGPASVDALGAASHVSRNAAEALLRVLEAEGLAVARAPGYALSGFGRLFLTRRGAHSMSDTLDLMAAQAAAFAELPSCMANGSVPSSLDISSATSRYGAFLGAVNEYVAWAGRDLLRQIELPEVRSFIVGSMGVSFSALLLERFPAAEVTYGCLAHLVREIPRLRDRYRVPPARVRGEHAHGGDPEADRWGDEAFDLVFLTKKMMLQPERAIGERFARKAFQVLRPGGLAIFWETVHTQGAPTPLVRAMEAVLDLGASPNARVSTEPGLRRLLGDIGYQDVQIVPCLGGQTTFVVARR